MLKSIVTCTNLKYLPLFLFLIFLIPSAHAQDNGGNNKVESLFVLPEIESPSPDEQCQLILFQVNEIFVRCCLTICEILGQGEEEDEFEIPDLEIFEGTPTEVPQTNPSNPNQPIGGTIWR